MKRQIVKKTAIGIGVALCALVALARDARAEDLCSAWEGKIDPVVTERESNKTNRQSLEVSFDLPSLIDCRDPYFCLPRNFEVSVAVRKAGGQTWEECERISLYTHFDCPAKAEEYEIILAFNSDLTDVQGSTVLGGETVYYGDIIERDDCEQALSVDAEDVVPKNVPNLTVGAMQAYRPVFAVAEDDDGVTLRVDPSMRPYFINPALLRDTEENEFGINSDQEGNKTSADEALPTDDPYALLGDGGGCSLAGGAVQPCAFALLLAGLMPLAFLRRKQT